MLFKCKEVKVCQVPSSGLTRHMADVQPQAALPPCLYLSSFWHQVQKSPVFRRDGADIHSDLFISIAQAILGGTAKAQGLYETINVTVREHGDSCLCCPGSLLIFFLPLPLPSFLRFYFFFGTDGYVSSVDLELVIQLPQPSLCQDCVHVPLCPVNFFLNDKQLRGDLNLSIQSVRNSDRRGIGACDTRSFRLFLEE